MSEPKKPAGVTQRSYVVLHNDGENYGADLLWRELGHADGATDRQAIANLIASVESGPVTGRFVAVPARSWRPTDRQVHIVEKAVWT